MFLLVKRFAADNEQCFAPRRHRVPLAHHPLAPDVKPRGCFMLCVFACCCAPDYFVSEMTNRCFSDRC
jgi:hypothetical protein